MVNLLQAELYKITHTKVMAICLVFTAGIEFVNSFLHGGNQIDTMTLLIEIIGLISCFPDFLSALISAAGLSFIPSLPGKAGAAYGSVSISHFLWPVLSYCPSIPLRQMPVSCCFIERALYFP